MRCLVVALILALTPFYAWAAEEPAAPASPISATITRGVDFLTKDALLWQSEHKCASCHHAALVFWSLEEAKAHGFAADEAVLNDLRHAMAERSKADFTGTSPANPTHAVNMTALDFSLALEADPQPDPVVEEGIKTFLQILVDEQAEDGSWSGWPTSRLPMQGVSAAITVRALLALLPAAARGDETARMSRDKGLAWLAATKPDDDDSQADALSLILLRRLDRPAAEWEPLAGRIRERQRTDGGWSQTREMESDAYATGQALYALAVAGAKGDDPAIERGRAFLTGTQREDGSWAMTSRPAQPDGRAAKNLIPITGAGSAWAVLGLVRSL